MNTHLLTNARIITPTENFLGSVEIEDGIITNISKQVYTGGIDLNGQWLAPGCIDIHTDYLEKELHPRPEANFSLPFALHYLDSRAANCGITTVFSALSLSDDESKQRTFGEAVNLAKEIDSIKDHLLVRHFLHARIDPNTDAILRYLPELQQLESLRLVVFNENIPGERQYRLDDLIMKRAKSQGISIEQSRTRLLQKIEETRKINHRQKIQEAFGHKCILGSHDDTDTEHVLEAVRYGASLSEMPTTLEAAMKAKQMDLWICMGAPNYYRGGSHCGNLSCHEAMEHGLVDILCSDYHFPTMLGSVVKMIQDKRYSPSYAFNLVSLNPARLLHFDNEIGSIETGKRADLISFGIKGSLAAVSHVFVDGVRKNQSHFGAAHHPLRTPVNPLNTRLPRNRKEHMMYFF